MYDPSLRRHLHALRNAVRLAAVDLLARLGDGAQHLLVRQLVLSDDRDRLRVERDVVGFDACAVCYIIA
jgi:hypothetical protein